MYILNANQQCQNYDTTLLGKGWLTHTHTYRERRKELSPTFPSVNRKGLKLKNIIHTWLFVIGIPGSLWSSGKNLPATQDENNPCQKHFMTWQARKIVNRLGALKLGED